MAKFVQEALIPLQGETITIKSDGREVIIGDHFAEEFARSNDTAHSYAKNKAVKLNSYPNVRDIVEAGVNPQNNPNAKTQHDEKVNPKKKDASRGWVYYDSPLLVKNGDEYSKYNVVPNIRLASDGNDYLYDITHYRKNKTEAEVTSHPPRDAVTKPSASETTIPQSDKNGTEISDLRRSLNDHNA